MLFRRMEEYRVGSDLKEFPGKQGNLTRVAKQYVGIGNLPCLRVNGQFLDQAQFFPTWLLNSSAFDAHRPPP